MKFSQNGNHHPVEDEISLLDYWRAVWKSKWLIGILCATAVTAAYVFSVLSPKSYESTATILIPKEGGGGGLLSMIAASGLVQQAAGASMPSLTPNRDLFLSILKSRLIAAEAVESFKLQERWRTATMTEAIERARGIPKIFVTKEGVIEIRVEDTDPAIAADLANFYVDQLDRLVSDFGTAAATRQRRFIEEQLARAAADLQNDEETLRHFQETNRAILLGDMTNSMRLPGNQVPRVGIELARLLRDLRVQETVYTLLTQQLEQAKIAEAQDMPVVQFLDRGVPAVRHSKPNTRLNMALAGGVSVFIGVLLGLMLHSPPKPLAAAPAVEKVQRRRVKQPLSKTPVSIHELTDAVDSEKLG